MATGDNLMDGPIIISASDGLGSFGARKQDYSGLQKNQTTPMFSGWTDRGTDYWNNRQGREVLNGFPDDYAGRVASQAHQESRNPKPIQPEDPYDLMKQHEIDNLTRDDTLAELKIRGAKAHPSTIADVNDMGLSVEPESLSQGELGKMQYEHGNLEEKSALARSLRELDLQRYKLQEDSKNKRAADEIAARADVQSQRDAAAKQRIFDKANAGLGLAGLPSTNATPTITPMAPQAPAPQASVAPVQHKPGDIVRSKRDGKLYRWSEDGPIPLPE